ncbi:MAG: CvpA family protein [Gemmataceae bacterium]
MLLFFTLAVMGAAAYAAAREGLLTAITSLVNVVISGLVAFNFFEPIANELEELLRGSFLAGFEDAIALFAPFAATLAALRVLTINLANTDLELPALLQQVGSGAIALLTGYLVAGFLVVVFQTLPWGDTFLGFDYSATANTPKARNLMPPDRVWLAMMSRAGAMPLSQEDSVTFDPEGSFEIRYGRLRRFKE